MKELLKIKYSSQKGMSEEHEVSNVGFLQMAEGSEVSLNLKFPSSYFPNNQTYSLVILSKEELKGLEGKTK
ncbi:MAG: hypothetical protein WC511_05225 [Candidatus Pacearchaeota archaeon]